MTSPASLSAQTPPQHKTLKSRLQPLLLTLGAIALLLVVATNIWVISKANNEAQTTAAMREGPNRLMAILLDLRHAESAQRGYLVNGQIDYKNEYRRTIEQMPGAYQQALDILKTEGRPLVAIKTVIDQRIGVMNRAMALFDNGDRAGAIALMASGEGDGYMQRVREVVVDLSNKINANAHSRADAAQQINRRALFITLGGATFIILIGGIGACLVRLSNREHEATRREFTNSNTTLETIVAARTADLAEAHDEIQRFADIVGNDLRAPLVNIIGFTSELDQWRKEIAARLASLRPQGSAEIEKDKALEQHFSDALGSIRSSIARMDRLINAILKLSREGRREFNPEAIELTALVSNLKETLAHQTGSADAEISIGALPAITSDRLAIEQIFFNLMENSLRYLQPGRPGRISITAQTSPSGYIFEVSDNGRGIDPKDHQRIFDLFRRAGVQDKPGEGIGLAHVRALVRRLGGTIRVKSALREGSSFTITLPYR